MRPTQRRCTSAAATSDGANSGSSGCGSGWCTSRGSSSSSIRGWRWCTASPIDNRAMAPSQPPERAAFNPLIRPYLVLYVGAILAGTIVLLPLTMVWFCGVGQWWARHYFDKLECELRDTAIRYRKGILVQFEKTIPLENI